MDSSSSSSSAVGMKEEEERPHVLVVDDSLIDRIIMEKLFTNSACKGILFLNCVCCHFVYNMLSFISFNH